ncbi:HTH-type transcriptional activator RhaR [Haloferula sargassicola]|uniref:HTH-type transcriptional activator RhaR n=2 Tax=Haloferula sargassicola TaxID=490096 RepID=A0ABP9UP18_9BACT
MNGGVELKRWIDLSGVSCWRLGGRSVHAGSTWQTRVSGEIWLWLNGGGEGVIWGAEDRMYLRPGMYAIFGEDTEEKWRWTRLPGDHQAEVLVISRSWIARRLGGTSQHVHPRFSQWLTGGGKLAFAGLMSGPEKELMEGLQWMTGSEPGASLRVEARVLEWAAVRLFRTGRSDAGAGFCHAIRSRTDPVKRALAVMEERLAEPMDLKTLGRECGVSPTHLSRMVKQRTGRTLREHLRRIRVAHACELLSVSGTRVTEVALDVGYQSLSHFAKAFREETGKSPGEWARR